MKSFIATIILFVVTSHVLAQTKTSVWLEKLLRSKASSLLQQVLDQPDTFRYQIIYTQINRDKNNQPHFKNYFLHLDADLYFNPASTVKLPVALSALEKLHELNMPALSRNSQMLTDSSYGGQIKVYSDSLSADGVPSVAQYIKEIFLISDNDAYNRLYEFVGQETLNDKLRQKGYTNSRITRRFMPMTEEENRHTNAINFLQNGQLIYRQPPAYNMKPFDFSKQYLVGKAYYNRHDSLISQPMDFTTHNVLLLQDLQQLLQSVLFPASVPVWQRFKLTADDYKFLYQYMSELPYESKYPHYDTTAYFESYTKFFMFKAGKQHIPEHIRIFNKPGWSYGFLTDAAYIADFKNNIEFMISASIYTNNDGILNDDKYDYDTVGYPFFKEVGNIIYQYELTRRRKYKPDLSSFHMNYSDK
jgi:Beta-lactamase enzyme family